MSRPSENISQEDDGGKSSLSILNSRDMIYASPRAEMISAAAQFGFSLVPLYFRMMRPTRGVAGAARRSLLGSMSGHLTAASITSGTSIRSAPEFRSGITFCNPSMQRDVRSQIRYVDVIAECRPLGLDNRSVDLCASRSPKGTRRTAG